MKFNDGINAILFHDIFYILCHALGIAGTWDKERDTAEITWLGEIPILFDTNVRIKDSRGRSTILRDDTLFVS